MNRAQRRAARKATPACMRATKEQRIAALLKNGITPEDLEREYERGFKEGFKAAAPATFKAIYAAVCKALRKLYRFGRYRCSKVLMAVDDIVVNSLTSEEIIDEVWEEIGLYLNFEEPFDRIEYRRKAS